MPEDQTLPVIFLNRKQIEFTTEATMIAFLSFFALLQPRIELFLGEESRAVDTLHLRQRCIAFPVSAGERKQFESAQLVRVGNMWAKTEIDERRAVDVVDAHLLACLFVDQFTLQRLFAFSKNTQRLVLGNLLAAITKVLARDLLHALLNYWQITF